MPGVEVAPQNQENNNDDHGPINAVVGIIYPPPEVRSILHKKVQFKGVILLSCLFL